ncbi:TniQ family protein [Nostocaceae cyanobacterium CENA369]|uniref:TniQ family protein n=1 Tax=Dendronalium phyllosphericum CENA369 TaxID=1725256 RepID=A0A8J7LLF3_9NOST|nr:helix-turn-helix domain-containing protein [Dendronalium phyllosphericum]MBH8578329.1 TniQ family protein [Dendronalium phyllosphericum CENA369]
MDTNDLYNLKEPSTPLRSRLYHIEPIGIGTSLVESLTSYIARLAEAHCLFPGVLLERELAPILNKAYGSTNLDKIYPFTGALNGTGVMAADLIQAIQKLTLSNNLQFLTLITWSKVFPFRNLLCSARAWCPYCYQDNYIKSQIVYEPLLWSLNVVKICLHHKQKLYYNCHHCHQKNYVLAWKSRPGYCSKCLRWLGLPFDAQLSDRKDSNEDELKFEIWTAKTVGDLLAKSPYLTFAPLKENIAKSLCAYVSKVAEGNIAEFARQLQIPRNTVWLWCKGQNLPSINTLLYICYCLKISLLDFFKLEEDLVNSPQSLRLPVPQMKSSRRLAIKRFDADKVKQNLEAVLESHECPAPSMEEVARRLKCDRRTILRHFPDLCHAISARYLNAKKATFEQNIEQSCKEIRYITQKLHNQGIYPSEKRVSEQMTMPGYLRYPKVRLALQEIRCQLGK